MRTPTISLAVLGAVVVLTGTPIQARGADDLSAARDLYASAAYEEALDALNRMRATGAPLSAAICTLMIAF